MPASKTTLIHLDGRGPKEPKEKAKRAKPLTQSRFIPPAIAADPYIKASDLRRAAWRSANDDLGLIPDELRDLALRIYNLETEVKLLSKEYDSKRLAVEIRISEERRNEWREKQREIRDARMARLEEAKAKLAGKKTRRSNKISAERQAEIMDAFAAFMKAQGIK